MIDYSRIWHSLSNPSIGFYTSSNNTEIPNDAGVYAWFNPINLKTNENLEDQIEQMRSIQSYHAKNKDILKLEKNFDIKWDPIKLTLEKDLEKQTLKNSALRSWKKIKSQDLSTKENIRLYTQLGTIFTRPLYIGITKNLKSRYEDHINGYGDDNNFNKRFTDYVKKLGGNMSVNDLLFVGINYEKAKNNKDKNIFLDENLKLIESILQTLGQPVFSER